MSMEIYGNYNSYSDYTELQQSNSKANCDGVTTSTVDLKTSNPGVVKFEQINTGYKNVNDYSKYLQSKYSYMNTGKTSMSGIPTTVTVSIAFLEKCNKDPEKAKYLEENLAAIPDGVNSLNNYVKSHGLGSPVVTYASYTIDSNGNVSMASGSTNDPDGRIARENAEKKAKEKQEAEKKAADKRAAKKVKDERAEKKRAEKLQAEERLEKAGTDDINISITGNSVESVTKAAASFLSAETDVSASGFDAKA